MPSTESFPFRRLSVDHMVRGVTRVAWAMHRNFQDPAPHVFQLQYGHAGVSQATDWVDVGSPVVDGYLAMDDTPRLQGKRLLSYYRVVLTTPLHTYVSPPASVYGDLDEKEWLLCREITRRETLRHRLVSHEGYLLKRIRYGVPCDRCRDELTGQVTDSYCPDCHGVGFVLGYHPPVPFVCFDISPLAINERRNGTQIPGQTQLTIANARALGFPDLSAEDVWVDAKNDQRWLIKEVQHTAEFKGIPLVRTITLALAPMSHAVYRVEVGGEPSRDQDLPDAGCGSVEVDHNYGGEDALAYQLEDGRGVVGATILAFVAADYAAGLRAVSAAKAATTTLANGRWSYALKLDPGNYVLVYEKRGEYGPDTHELTVAAPLLPSSDVSSPSWASDFGV